MSPQDERVHEFVRDLNRYRHAFREHVLQDVPHRGTDEYNQWQDRKERFHDQRQDLKSVLNNLLRDV